MERIDDRAEGAPEAGQDRNFVMALARGLDVLRCFRRGEPSLSNNNIARRTGLPKPTVTRLTHTLCELGYLAHSEATGLYRLGAGVLELGYGVLAGIDIAERAAEVMRRLHADGPNPNVSVALGERHRFKMVYVAVERSRESVSLSMSVGSRLPLFHSAMGRAALCAMAEGQRAPPFWRPRRPKGARTWTSFAKTWTLRPRSTPGTAIAAPSASGGRRSAASPCRCGRSAATGSTR